MKKITIMAVAIAIGAFANAATVNWSMAGVCQPETTTAGSGYAVYLFQTSDTMTMSTIASAVEGGSFASIASSALANGQTLASGAFMKTGLGNYSGTAETPYTAGFVAIVFDASAFADAENYAIAETTLTFTSATGSKTALFSNFSANNEWQAIAVPEPTSGLLMLVGLAGLALRRRRA